MIHTDWYVIMHVIFPMSTRKSKLSVEVMPSASGLHLEATHRSYRCLRIEKRVDYGWVIEEKYVEWQTLQLPWDGRLKFTYVSQ
jgi:hypothetical protein